MTLKHYNYNDGISIKITDSSGNINIGYSKISQCILAKC